MSKIPDCDRCQFYGHSPYTVCAVHPFGVNDEKCLDFRQDPNAEPEELWEPEGASYVDGELVIERAYYNGEEIPQPQQRLTRQEQWEIWKTHPFFTGVYPNCGYQFPPHIPELIHARLHQLWMD